MIGINWRIGGPYGWGVFGLNLAVELARTGGNPPVPLLEPMGRDAGPLQSYLLAPGWAEQRRLAALAATHPGQPCRLDAIVLHALMGEFQPIAPSPFTGTVNAGLIFFENTRFSADSVHRAAGFDCVVAGSSWNAGILRGLGLTNVVLAPQGVDPALFHPASKVNLFPGRFVVFAGGKLEYRKGQDIALAAFRRFHARHPDALLLAAWQSPFPHLGAEMAAGPHVAADPRIVPGGVDVTGWLLENGLPAGSFIDCGLVDHWKLAPLLREADAAIFPNRCEGGTNLVAMEAMACGVPSILSANTGHLDLIETSDPLVLRHQGQARPTRHFPATEGWGESDPDEIVALLEQLYTDREHARRCAAAAARRMQDWSWSKQVRRLVEQLPEGSARPLPPPHPPVRHRPDVPAAMFAKAVAHHQNGEFELAAALYHDLRHAHPELGAVTGNFQHLLEQALSLAVQCLGKADFTAAAAHARFVLRHRPDDEGAWRILGAADMSQSRWTSARRAFHNALASRPDNAQTYRYLVYIVIESGQRDAVGDIVQRSLILHPEESIAAYQLGVARLKAGDLEGAHRCLRLILVLTPDYTSAWCDLGVVMTERGRLPEALAAFQRAITLDDGFAAAQWGKAKALLLNGQFDDGWAGFAWRLRIPGWNRPFPSAPAWDGRTGDRRTILIYGELGHGDTLLCIRYAALLARHNKVVAAVQPALVRLLSGLPELSACVLLGQDVPAFDACCSMLDLPRLCASLTDVVPAAPYLRADPACAAAWQPRLSNLPGLRIGLVWSGDPRRHAQADEAMNRRRSLSLAALAPLGLVPGVSFVSLQKGEAASEALSPPPGLALFDPMADVEDFADTAAIITNLDLVISVDTAVAHLTGALGKPIWMLNRFEAGFPWQLDGREDTVWYPTMRIFRQTDPGDWGPVVRRVAAALAEFRS